jgi:IS5 family transposase
VKALPGNPYDGHTLAVVIPEMEALLSNTIERILADKGYRGHNAPPDYKFRVFTSGQKATNDAEDQTRAAQALRCRAGHRPSQSRTPNGPQLLWHRRGDATNAIPAAAGYNFRRLIRWLKLLLFQILAQLIVRLQLKSTFFRDD